MLVLFAREGLARVFENGDFAQVEDAAAVLKVAAEGNFTGAGEGDVEVGFAARDDAAGVQDLEGAFDGFDDIGGFLGGGGDVVVAAFAHRSRGDQHLAVGDALVFDDLSDGFEQQGAAGEEDAIGGLDGGGLKDARRGRIGRQGGRGDQNEGKGAHGDILALNEKGMKSGSVRFWEQKAARSVILLEA